MCRRLFHRHNSEKKSDIQFCLLISISLWKNGISLFRWSKKMRSTGQSDQNWWFQPALASFFFFWMQYASVNRLWAVCWHVIWGSSDCNREDAILTIDLLNPCHRIRCNAVINVLYMFGWNNRSWQFAGKSWSRSHLLSDEFHTTEMFLQHAARLMRPSHLILSVWWEKSPGDPDSDLCILYTSHSVI